MRLVPTTFAVVCIAWGAQAANWGQWRGPSFNGSTSETNLPTTWSKTENIKWTTPLPGYSGATPVVWEDSVFVASPDADKNLVLICVDRRTGVVRWQQKVSAGDRDKGRNNMTSPSPVTDGERVIAMFATGDLAAFDFAGKELWKRNLAKEYGAFANMWIYGSSPLLYDGRLYIQVLQRSPVPRDYSHAQDGKPDRESYLLCLDPRTGNNLWRQVRKSEESGESMEAYTTPVPMPVSASEAAAKAEILMLGAGAVSGHDAKTGAELWRCGGLNPREQPWWRVVPCPVVAGDVIVACGPRREPVFGIKPGVKDGVAWETSDYTSDCVTPLYYRQHLYLLDGDRQIIYSLEPATGRIKWQGSLGVREIFRASPTGADGKIYCVSESGTVVVLAAGDSLRILSTIPMGETPVRSTIAVAQGELFLRTAKNLYCIGQSQPKVSQ